MCEELTEELADGRAAATALCEHLARMRADSVEQPIALEWGGQTLRFVVSARLDRAEERWRKELADAARKEERERCAEITNDAAEVYVRRMNERRTTGAQRATYEFAAWVLDAVADEIRARIYERHHARHGAGVGGSAEEDDHEKK